MASDTYTGELGAAENLISSLSSAYSSGLSGLPGINASLRKSLFEREKTLPALEVENEAKIKELYSADQRYADRYGNPESDMFIEDPMARQGLISGQKADIRGELGNILNLIQQRTQTMGNAIDKGMEMYKMGLEAQKLELDQAEKSWSRIMEKMQFEESKKKGGGSGTAGERAETETIAALQRDISSYDNFENLVKRYGVGPGGAGLESYKIRQAYDAFHTGQNFEPWGPAQEDSQDVLDITSPQKAATYTATEQYDQDLEDAAVFVLSNGGSDEAKTEAVRRLNKAHGGKGVSVQSDLYFKLQTM